MPWRHRVASSPRFHLPRSPQGAELSGHWCLWFHIGCLGGGDVIHTWMCESLQPTNPSTWGTWGPLVEFSMVGIHFWGYLGSGVPREGSGGQSTHDLQVLLLIPIREGFKITSPLLVAVSSMACLLWPLGHRQISSWRVLIRQRFPSQSMQGQKVEALMEVGDHHAEALSLSGHISGEKLAILRLGTGISFMAHHNGFCDRGPSASTKCVPIGGTP